ncbi:MAG: alpha/beta hydrolase-fold protein [Gemmatimonadota bacterium]
MRNCLQTTNRVMRALLLTGLLGTWGTRASEAQQAERVRAGTVERIQVYGPGLAGNLSGDSATRHVTVYLPPAYGEDPLRRFPVVYLLHGYTDDDLHWMGFEQHFVNVPAAADAAHASGGARELIVVMPNAYTRFQGSMYANSVTTGNWEDFVARDLVSYIDAHYRTIPQRDSRGLAGHSMGGYGAVRIGMRNTDTFGSVYAMSPCCMPARTASPAAVEAMARAEAVTDMAQFARADFGTRALFASAAAWAPNPENPPFFLDLPTKGGEPQPDVLARMAANAPLAMVDQHIAHLRGLRGLALDSGDDDGAITEATRELHRILEKYNVAHEFEIYPGDHLSGVMERVEKNVLPFFSRTLSFAPAAPRVAGDTITTASGLRYVFLQRGAGERPQPGDRMVIHGIGRLVDGTEFWNTRTEGRPYRYRFLTDRVIRGFEEGMRHVRVGDRVEITMSPELGYGERGNRDIPPHATLIFDYEILSIERE